MYVDGDFIQIGFWHPRFGMQTTPGPNVNQNQWDIATWQPFDSHSLIKPNDISVGEFNCCMWEGNDESNPQGIAEEIFEQFPDGWSEYSVVGIGSFGDEPYSIRALRHNYRSETEPLDWTELPLVRVVSLIGDDGRPGSATLTVGLQGIDENHDPLPEMGIITDVPIPYFLSGRFCDRDFDGVRDLQDLPAGSFSEFTSLDSHRNSRPKRIPHNTGGFSRFSENQYR